MSRKEPPATRSPLTSSLRPHMQWSETNRQTPGALHSSAWSSGVCNSGGQFTVPASGLTENRDFMDFNLPLYLACWYHQALAGLPEPREGTGVQAHLPWVGQVEAIRYDRDDTWSPYSLAPDTRTFSSPPWTLPGLLGHIQPLLMASPGWAVGRLFF